MDHKRARTDEAGRRCRRRELRDLGERAGRNRYFPPILVLSPQLELEWEGNLEEEEWMGEEHGVVDMVEQGNCDRKGEQAVANLGKRLLDSLQNEREEEMLQLFRRSLRECVTLPSQDQATSMRDELVIMMREQEEYSLHCEKLARKGDALSMAIEKKRGEIAQMRKEIDLFKWLDQQLLREPPQQQVPDDRHAAQTLKQIVNQCEDVHAALAYLAHCSQNLASFLDEK
jgi:hypothetical protein